MTRRRLRRLRPAVDRLPTGWGLGVASGGASGGFVLMLGPLWVEWGEHDPPTIQRESIEDALENDRCGICGSVDHFREDHPAAATHAQAHAQADKCPPWCPC